MEPGGRGVGGGTPFAPHASPHPAYNALRDRLEKGGSARSSSGSEIAVTNPRSSFPVRVGRGARLLSHTAGVALTALGLLAPAALAGTVHVDGSNPVCPGSGTALDPFCTIQDGIAAALPGDDVLVQPGTYAELIDFLGKDIVVESAGGAFVTTLDGTGLGGSVVSLVNGEGAGAVLRGFTITGGTGTGPMFFSSGGGVRCVGSSPVIEDNVISQNFADNGGGISSDGGSPLIQGNEIRDNNAVDGQGIHALAAADLRILDNTIADNTFAVTLGGGVYVDDCTLLFEGNTVSGNSASSSGGMAVFSSAVTIRGNDFLGNFTDEDEGGALGLYQSSGTVSDNHFEDNGSSGRGGAIVSFLSTMTIERNTFVNNACGGEGGSIASVANPNDTIRDNVFDMSWANFGSTLFLQGGTVASRNVIRNSLNSEAVRLFAGAVFEDGVISDSVAGCDVFGDATIRRTTITGCLSGVSAFGATATVESCVLWGNSLAAFESSGGVVDISWSDVEGGWPGVGNIDADPLFVNAGGGDYTLQPGSPCIDTGDPADAVCGLDASAGGRRSDGLLDGGSRVDMGGLEFSHVRLSVPQPANPASPLLVSTTGSALPTFLFAALGTDLACVEPWGTFQVDLGGTFILRFFGTGPLNLNTSQPAGASGITVHVQAVATDPTFSLGNASNLQTITFP